MMKKLRLLTKLLPVFLLVAALTGCHNHLSQNDTQNTAQNTTQDTFADLKKTGSMDLKYADQFSVDYYENGYSLITIADGTTYLLCPEETAAPKDAGEGVLKDAVIILQPTKEIYLAASSAMDFFRALDALDQVTMTSTKDSDWSIPEIADRIDNGQMTYVGKYSAPDYETIIGSECNLAIESTMIYHTPEVKEELESMGIPVLVERSSYEAEPMGRLEWIRLYGLLTGKTEEAEQYFETEDAKLADLDPVDETDESDQPTVAFFYISSNGYVNVRKPGDYISKMITMADGHYVLNDMELDEDQQNAMSTMNMQMESFYDYAVDADILIYNSTIEGEITTIDELLEKSDLLKDFKAVKEGNVWCTGQNMFQQTTGMSDMILDLKAVISGTADSDELTYLHRLKE